MAIEQWPADLPTRHILSSWSRAPARGPDITSFEAGPDLQREVGEASGYDEPITIAMTAAQRASFWTFWEVALHRGADFFEMPIYDPSSPTVPVKTCMIIGKPQEKEVAADRFHISIQRRVY